MADVFSITRGGYRAAKGQKKAFQDKLMVREELQMLLDVSREDDSKYGHDGYDLFALAGNFALRCSEALSLGFEDFKPIAMGYFRAGTLKKKGEQLDRVYVGKAGAKLVQEILESRKRATKGRDLLFPFTSRTARYLFAYYAEKAGLSPNVSFHSLRHTSARMMLEAIKKQIEYPDRIINAFLRHKPTTTEIYAYPSPAEMIKAMDLKGIVR